MDSKEIVIIVQIVVHVLKMDSQKTKTLMDGRFLKMYVLIIL